MIHVSAESLDSALVDSVTAALTKREHEQAKLESAHSTQIPPSANESIHVAGLTLKAGLTA